MGESDMDGEAVEDPVTTAVSKSKYLGQLNLVSLLYLRGIADPYFTFTDLGG